MDDDELKNVEAWVKLLSEAEEKQMLDDPLIELIRIGVFDMPNLIKIKNLYF